VHNYDRPAASTEPLPSIAEFRFNDALDVVAYAEINPCLGWNTWPEVWHLDDEGRRACGYRASSCDSLTRWARNPSDLRRSRREGLASGGCADRWVIVDSRRVGLDDPPDEGDGQAFLTLRRSLRRIGVELVDAVVFDDEGHWWSLHELTAGTTAWTASVA
jgi:hypothetical protein